jgi:hypothetical protein
MARSSAVAPQEHPILNNHRHLAASHTYGISQTVVSLLEGDCSAEQVVLHALAGYGIENNMRAVGFDLVQEADTGAPGIRH